MDPGAGSTRDRPGSRRGTAGSYFRLLDRLNAAVRQLVGLLLFAMCLLALFQVVVRLVLTTFGVNLSAPWSEEIGRSLMIWLIFLATAYAFRTGQMVALRVLVTRLPLRLQRWADAAVGLVVLGFVGVLFQVGLRATEFGWIEKSPVLGFDKAYVYLAMPVAAALIAVNAVSTLVERGLFRRSYAPAAAEDVEPVRSVRG
jgi:TRAP-type C4-dicarboxylate transport system permease small subunit